MRSQSRDAAGNSIRGHLVAWQHRRMERQDRWSVASDESVRQNTEFVRVRSLALSMGLPQIIAENAARIHVDWLEKAREKGVGRRYGDEEAARGASLMAASRMRRYHLPYRRVSVFLGVDQSRLVSALRALQRVSGLPGNVLAILTPEQIVGSVVEQAGYPGIVRERAVLSLREWQSHRYTPAVLAGAALWNALGPTVQEVGVLEDRVAELIGVTEASLEGALHTLRNPRPEGRVLPH